MGELVIMGLGSAHMTETTEQVTETHPGMAHFAGTGPAGKTCGDCKFRGYERESSRGNLYTFFACAKFKKLTGIHGRKIEPSWKACKYFEQRAGK